MFMVISVWVSQPCMALPAENLCLIPKAYTSLYTQDGSRLKLVASRPGKNQNIILLPGGPGMDASYLMGLVNLLNVEGNIWLLDLPGNGNNTHKNPNFNLWQKSLVKAISSLDNVILIGHSFGGCIALATPEIEPHIKALVLLDAAPRNMTESLIQEKEKFNLPDTTPSIVNYQKNPSNKALINMWVKWVDYYFSKSSRAEGEKLMSEVICNHKAVDWAWVHFWPGYSVKWVPKIPTLVVSGALDHMCPFYLFEKDSRFLKNNIRMVEVKEAGHFPWVEQPRQVKNVLEAFIKSLI